MLDRVADHIREEDGCHIWTGSHFFGRPQITTGSMADGTRLPRPVHRVIWEEHHGPRPEGYDVHHVCENKSCVNVEHLVLLSHEEHSRHSMHVRWHVNRGIPSPDCPHCR